MGLGLRTRILLITVFTPLTLGLAALVTVHRSVKAHVDDSSIHESIERASVVFETMFATRARALGGGAAIIARDPRFFSLLLLGVDQRDARFQDTVGDMAEDLNRITQSDLFEVYDRRGRRVASTGALRSGPAVARSLVRECLAGRTVMRVVPLDTALVQLHATPVRADGRIVGALLLGSAVDGALARSLRTLLRSEVTFLVGDSIVASTLDRPGDRAALRARVAGLDSVAAADPRALGAMDVEGQDLTYVSVLRPLPQGDPGARLRFAMQRAFDPETRFQERIQADLALLAGIAVAAAVLTGLVLSGSITRPIRQLVAAAQAMHRGDYDVPIQVRGRHEIGYLAERFVQMRRRERDYVGGLEEAARLKTEFIRVASRELRTPLSVIAGYRDLLEGGTLGPLQPAQRRALEAMRDCIAQLHGVADRASRVLEVATERIEPHLAPHAVAPVIERGIGAALAAAPGRAVAIAKGVPPDLPEVPMDAGLLARALANLVANAIRGTPDGGRIEITAAMERGDLEIAVADEGPVPAPDRLDELFERGLAAADPLHSGAPHGHAPAGPAARPGLGSTRAIAEAHDGSLRHEHRRGGGNRFVLRLPGRAAPARAA